MFIVLKCLYVVFKVTLDTLHEHHVQTPAMHSSAEVFTRYHGSIVEVDRRLPMFSYTVEVLNMLVMPMVKTRSVDVLKITTPTVSSFH